MNNYNIYKHFNNEGKSLEEIIVDYFKIYLDMQNNIYE